MNNGHIMKIRTGRVNRPVIEDIIDEQFMDTAIFGMQYKQMLTLLDRYVKNKGNISGTDGAEASNNVFSFIGDRGSGKTSCMSSISKLLSNGQIYKFKYYVHLRQTPFAAIDIIDPSYFDQKHNIIAMMVAKLYKSFSQLEQTAESNKCNFDIHNELVDAFAKTQRSMLCLLDEDVDEEYDEIERLSDLSLAVDLKNDVQHLVQTYLRFFKKDNGVLILSIDDIDLNVDEADVMAEQIRKYLVSPNIVILLAVKLDQLTTIKNLHYTEKYNYLIDRNFLNYDMVEEMTGQYLAKFAPHDQRVYMPSSEFYLDSGIEIDGNSMFGDSVKQVIPELIFNRTRYLFYNTKQTASYVVPRNLRKMCQLVTLLWSMDSYCAATGFANKQTFRNYLFGSWVQDNLPQNDRLYIQRLVDGWKNEQLNKISLDVLREKYTKWVDKKQNSSISNMESGDLKEEIKAIFDEQNRDFNFSVGDVMSLVNNLQISYDTHTDKCFFFIMKSIYSMALYESYDLITEKQDKDGYDEFSEKEKVEHDNQVLLYDPFSDEHISTYHKLVGGRFFNYRLDAVLPKEKTQDSTVSRSDRMINYETLQELISDAIDSWNSYNASVVVANPKINEEEGQVKIKVRLVEFFMLCVIRDINRKNAKQSDQDYYNPEFRRSNNVYYNGGYNGKAWLYFDLGAFFYNITCMRACYQRFGDVGKELLQLCQKDGKEISLFAAFRNKAKEYRNYYALPHAWQSWASIRNTEILFDLNQMLQSKCKRMGGLSNRMFLRSYFEVIASYNIHTYDRSEEGSKQSINFEFTSEIVNLLANNDVEEPFNRVFAVKSDNPKAEKGAYSIDLEALLKGRYDARNRKSTVLRYLAEKESDVYENNKILVDTAFSGYSDIMSKKNIEEAGVKLNILLRTEQKNN